MEAEIHLVAKKSSSEGRCTNTLLYIIILRVLHTAKETPLKVIIAHYQLHLCFCFTIQFSMERHRCKKSGDYLVAKKAVVVTNEYSIF